MSRLTLPKHARAALDEQAKLDGTFRHSLQADSVSLNAVLTVEQGEPSIIARLSVCGRTTQSTFPRRPDSGELLALFIEATANDDFQEGPEAEAPHEVSAMAQILQTAISAGRGAFDLPLDDLDVCLRMRGQQAILDVNDVARMVLHLPQHRQAAYEMLTRNVQRFLAGYRAARDAA